MHCCQLCLTRLKVVGINSEQAIVLPYVGSSRCLNHRVLVKCVYLVEYYRLMICYVNLFIGLLRKLKTVQIQLYMPAYYHLFSYTLLFVNGGTHYCLYNGSVLACKSLFLIHLSYILILRIAFYLCVASAWSFFLLFILDYIYIYIFFFFLHVYQHLSAINYLLLLFFFITLVSVNCSAVQLLLNPWYSLSANSQALNQYTL